MNSTIRDIIIVIIGGMIVFWLLAVTGVFTKIGERQDTVANEKEETSTPQDTREVTLYYYNSEMDLDEQGNIMCSRKGLVGVTRNIPNTTTPIQDTIQLLLKGELSIEEQEKNITTEFPLDAVSLTGANLVDGKLTLEFSDPQNKTSGGSCRAGILWFQIEKTALQFDEVKSVSFTPDELFQP